jgi:hypothetical protein
MTRMERFGLALLASASLISCAIGPVRNSRGGLQAGGPFMVRQNAEANR